MNEKLSIAIIEDDPIQLKLLKIVLSKKFSEQSIHSFSNSMKALNFIKENKKIDLIILDIFMEEINGIDFLDAINSFYDIYPKNKPQVIICTAADEKEFRSRAFRRGVMDYIIKPFTPDELLIRIKRVLDFHEMKIKIRLLEETSLKDKVTNLWKKQVVMEELQIIAQLSQRYNINYTFILIELDAFDKYKELYTKKEVNHVLKSTGEVILQNIRNTDFAGRFSDYEFLVILPYTQQEGAKVLAQRILNDLIQKKFPHKKNSPDKIVTFTSGISLKENDEDSITVFQKADEALYYGKKNKKKVVCFTELIRN